MSDRQALARSAHASPDAGVIRKIETLKYSNAILGSGRKQWFTFCWQEGTLLLVAAGLVLSARFGYGWGVGAGDCVIGKAMPTRLCFEDGRVGGG
jgi:hypothetical protein